MTDSRRWYDDEAGPMVRLYAVTAGRAHPTSSEFDLLAVIHVEREQVGDLTLTPEQLSILQFCWDESRVVVDIASGCDLPVSVLRVLLGDLLRAGHIRVRPPAPPAQLVDVRLLRGVIDGLRAL
ncbi:DUF742 domain-containing protein [Streptomyces sp. NPDC049887]|uniref:DUF742 domain-containing protein n=1 Tax=unclassified Streptomyces TaxID=2593676 RepID=UPI0034313257